MNLSCYLRLPLLVGLTLVALLPNLYADDLPPSKPEVDVAEVHRRGDYVSVMGEGPRGAAEEAFVRAMAPPMSDADKWFVTVFYDDSPASKKLLSDFDKESSLLAFVYAQEPYKPWAHYNVYNMKDATQTWRTKEFRVTSTPTVVIQPPRNGTWGSPRNVVFHTGSLRYGTELDAKSLASLMTQGVQRYVTRMSELGFPKPVQPLQESSGPDKGGSNDHPLFSDQEQALTYLAPSYLRGAMNPLAQIPFQTPSVPYQPNPNPQVPTVPGQTFPPLVQPQPQTPQTVPTNPAPLSGILTFLVGLLSGGGGMALLKILLDIYRPVAALSPSKLDDLAVSIADRMLARYQQNQTPSVQPIVPVR